MLQSLTIRNLALLEEVSLEFDGGFTVVTGETGAGKSILLGALSLLAGERVDKTIIRQGEDACEVEAALWFADDAEINALLAELDLPECEDGVLLLKRSVARTRAPRIRVNGSMTTLGVLQRIGERWIDFHGPSEPRRLLKRECQLELLDLFAQAGPSRAVYQDSYHKWRALRAEKETLSRESQLPSDQIEFLGNQLRRMDAVDLSAEAIEELERDFSRVSRAQELTELAQAMASGLSDDEGVGPQLGPLIRVAGELAAIDEAAQGLVERLRAVGIEVADLAGEYASLAGQFAFEPEQVELLNERMNVWLEMKRKHGPDVTAVAQAREELRHRLESQGDLEGTLAKLDAEICAAEKTARKHAAGLRKLRAKAAGELASIAAGAIARLGFKKADFQIEVRATDTLGPEGDCEVEFLFSPNVGEAPRTLQKIASSGELARVMLALKTVLADLDAVPVLVFDEVDANVGGEIGRVVGEQMAGIGNSHQVLCVTHLPQVAAQGRAHFIVDKDQSQSRARVTIVPIHESRESRVDELARMLGDREAASARAHADELLGPA